MGDDLAWQLLLLYVGLSEMPILFPCATLSSLHLS